MLTWILSATAVLTPVQENDLTSRVDRAIERGVTYLLDEQSYDGAFGGHQPYFERGGTSLVTYALYRSGLDRDHPAILRARRYLAAHPDPKTYPLAFELLCLSSLGFDEDLEQRERVLEALLDLRQNAGWSYPGSLHGTEWRPGNERPDFSNLHCAAFGLWAAERAGAELPRDTWKRVAKSVLMYLNPPEEFLDANGEKRERAIYSYHVGTFDERPAMGAAGAAMLAIARGAESAKLGRKLEREVEEALALNHAWLDSHYSPIPPTGPGWFQYYWLFALERAETMNDWPVLNGQRVWESAATWLCDEQQPDGSWKNANPNAHLNSSQTDTAFAVLFLLRATRTADSEHRAFPRGAFEGPREAAVLVRGRARESIEVWVEGLAEAGLAPLRTEWVLDGEIVSEQEFEPGGRFQARLPVHRNGLHLLEAEVVARDSAGVEIRLSSGPIEVRVQDILEPWMEAAATARLRNLMTGAKLEVHASSQAAGSPAKYLTDGCSETRWLAEATDEDPWCELVFRKPIRGAALVLGPANSRSSAIGGHDRPLRVEVSLDGGKPRVFESPSEVLAPWVIPFERKRKVERVRVRILDREVGRTSPGLTGFSEIAVE